MITNTREHKTINGFTRPKHPFQVFIMIFFIQLICCVSIAIIPITDVLVQIILACLFYFLAIIIFIYALKTSYIDPTDDLIISQRNGLNIGQDQELYDYFCQFCDSYVSGIVFHNHFLFIILNCLFFIKVINNINDEIIYIKLIIQQNIAKFVKDVFQTLIIIANGQTTALEKRIIKNSLNYQFLYLYLELPLQFLLFFPIFLNLLK